MGAPITSFDLGDARRKRGSGPKELVITDGDGAVAFKAEVWPEVPAAVFDAGSKGDLLAAFRGLFRDEADAAVFMEQFSPSIKDMGDIFDGLYGMADLGEALASGLSSTSDGTT